MRPANQFRLTVTAVACCLAALLIGAGAPGPQTSEVLATMWNDLTVLAGPDGQPQWAEYAPPVEDSDRPYLVASPPSSEAESCAGWVRRFVNSNVLPADFQRHLLALKKWPKYRGEDVFVTWYKVGSRLIHIVEGNADVSVFTALAGEEAAMTAPDARAEFAVRVAESVLTSGMLPHPETGVNQMPSGIPGVTAGTWRTASLEIRRDAEGRFVMRTPSAPTAWAVRFLTDGRFVRFRLTKANPGPRLYADRSAPRFEASPADESIKRQVGLAWNNFTVPGMAPTESEVQAIKATPSEGERETSFERMARVLHADVMPPQFADHMLALKGWQGTSVFLLGWQGGNVFLVRQKVGPHWLQGIEGAGLFAVEVRRADGEALVAPGTDLPAYAQAAARDWLSEKMQPERFLPVTGQPPRVAHWVTHDVADAQGLALSVCDAYSDGVYLRYEFREDIVTSAVGFQPPPPYLFGDPPPAWMQPDLERPKPPMPPPPPTEKIELRGELTPEELANQVN